MEETEREWVVVNDDGFIYKRRKKQAPATLVENQDAVLSGQAQLHFREALARRKKMAMLLAQKEMYAAEVRDWEVLLANQVALPDAPIPETPASTDEVSLHSIEAATSRDDLQTLHLQVEAYERFVEQLQTLRGQGESICNQLEKDVELGKLGKTRLEQDLLREVTKLTPRTIIHSLTSKPGPQSAVADLPGKSRLGQLMA